MRRSVSATAIRSGRCTAAHCLETAWPPGRNEACWCGSTLKYKKCCRPRSRT
ncbi:hypothetical protein EEB14_22715 [Rhodococcus sp. WS4]|nr:hypothetical protein EEB14_22715 [Rhodococcus sp. WS4]